MFSIMWFNYFNICAIVLLTLLNFLQNKSKKNKRKKKKKKRKKEKNRISHSFSLPQLVSEIQQKINSIVRSSAQTRKNKHDQTCVVGAHM